MDVLGLCDICSKAGASFSCILCGKRVCNDCITIRGTCRRCSDGFTSEQDKKLVGKVLQEKGLDDPFKLA
jgi:hypothetical protein